MLSRALGLKKCTLRPFLRTSSRLLARYNSTGSALRCPRVVAFAGSVREGSWNVMLAQHAAGVARDLKADVSILDTEIQDLPLYSQDVERAGFPPSVLTVKAVLAEADALLIASPEYNGSVTPHLKNIIDWCSRPHQNGEPMASVFKGRVAGIMSASPGRLGGLRGLGHLRDILTSVGSTVAPTHVAVGASHDAFCDDGSLKSQAHKDMIQACVTEVVEMSGMWANRATHCEYAMSLRRAKTTAEYGEI